MSGNDVKLQELIVKAIEAERAKIKKMVAAEPTPTLQGEMYWQGWLKGSEEMIKIVKDTETHQ